MRGAPAAASRWRRLPLAALTVIIGDLARQLFAAFLRFSSPASLYGNQICTATKYVRQLQLQL